MEPSGLRVLVPSRGRPGNIERLAKNWLGDPRYELAVGIDSDDPQSNAYWRLHYEYGFTLIQGPNNTRGMGAVLNTMAALETRRNPAPKVIGFIGDDHQPRTEGWQQRILDYIAEHPLAIMYGDDTIHGRNLPTAVFMDPKVVSTLGYMVPPGAKHLFLDNFWRELGERLGTLHFDPHLVIEHLHPIAGKAEWDDGYREVNQGDVWEHDKVVFEKWCDEEAPEALARLGVHA